MSSKDDQPEMDEAGKRIADPDPVKQMEEFKRDGAAKRALMVAAAEAVHHAADPVAPEDLPKTHAGKSVDTRPESINIAAPYYPEVSEGIAKGLAAGAAVNMITEEERQDFLKMVSSRGAWNQAAYSVGRSGAAFRELCNQDPFFSLAVAQAVQDYRELLQAEIVRRGVIGWDEPVIGRVGKDEDGVVSHVRRFSDRLLELEAKAAWPQRYRENAPAPDGAGNQGGTLVVPGKLEKGEWGRVAETALKNTQAAPALGLEQPRTAALPPLTRTIK